MIHVASYNIRKSVGLDWRRQPTRILAVLHEIGADIVALQEVDRRFGSRVTSLAPELIAERTDYQLIRFGPRAASIGCHGNAILAHRDIQVIASRSLPLPALEPRGAAVADLRVNGFALRVVGVHFGLFALWRKRQANAVLAHLDDSAEPMPTVIMGDLNEWSAHGGCIAAFSRRHHVATIGPTFHSRRPFAALDRIIVSADLHIETAGVHHPENASIASDHLPIWARITPIEPQSGQTEWPITQSLSP